MGKRSIESFHVASYQTNFASHHDTRNRHFGFLLHSPVLENTTKCLERFLFSSYHSAKLPPSDKNISTHTRLKF